MFKLNHCLYSTKGNKIWSLLPGCFLFANISLLWWMMQSDYICCVNVVLEVLFLQEISWVVFV